jgi:hypothetical protein
MNSKSLGRIPTNERHNDRMISLKNTHPKKNSERKMNISRNLPASRLFFEDNKKADQERTQCCFYRVTQDYTTSLPMD